MLPLSTIICLFFSLLFPHKREGAPNLNFPTTNRSSSLRAAANPSPSPSGGGESVMVAHRRARTCTIAPLPPPPPPPSRRCHSRPPTASSAVNTATNFTPPLSFSLLRCGFPSSTLLTCVFFLFPWAMWWLRSEGRRRRDDQVRRQRALRRALLRPAARPGVHAHPPRRQGSTAGPPSASLICSLFNN